MKVLTLFLRQLRALASILSRPGTLLLLSPPQLPAPLKSLLLLIQLETVPQAQPLQKKYICNGLSFSTLALPPWTLLCTLWTWISPSGSVAGFWCLWKIIYYLAARTSVIFFLSQSCFFSSLIPVLYFTFLCPTLQFNLPSLITTFIFGIFFFIILSNTLIYQFFFLLTIFFKSAFSVCLFWFDLLLLLFVFVFLGVYVFVLHIFTESKLQDLIIS